MLSQLRVVGEAILSENQTEKTRAIHFIDKMMHRGFASGLGVRLPHTVTKNALGVPGGSLKKLSLPVTLTCIEIPP